MDGLVRRRFKFVGAPLRDARTDRNGCFGAPPNADRGRLHRDGASELASATAARARCLSWHVFALANLAFWNPPERTGLALCVLA